MSNKFVISLKAQTTIHPTISQHHSAPQKLIQLPLFIIIFSSSNVYGLDFMW